MLVGRDRELADLAAAVASPPAVAVVAGESGIGKTRLAVELSHRPELADRRFVTGWCRRIREPFPLGPVLDAARACVDGDHADGFSPVVGSLRPWLPELGERLPAAPSPLPDRVAERHRAFRALAEVLARPGPVVLILEDLHWADEQTIDFLQYLLADPPGQLSLVVTYRSEDVTAQVRALTAKLPATVTRAEAVLAPLDTAQTGALAAAVLGVDRVSAELADDLYARTAGSPFAVEELLVLLRQRGDPGLPDGSAGAAAAPADLSGEGPSVPAGVRDLVLERAGRLAGDARWVVDAAAVLQVPSRADVLAAVCGLSMEGAVAGVDRALAVGLLVEHPTGVGFRHLLAAQAVYGDLSGPRRELLHTRAAAALRERDPQALGPVAYHLRHSGDTAAWVEAAQRAAARAAELGHDDEAARLLDDLLRHAPLGPVRRGRVAVSLARAALETLRPQPVDVLHRALEADLEPPVRGELRLLTGVLLERTERDPLQQRRLCRDAIPDLDDRPVLQAWAMVCLGIPVGREVPVDEHRYWLGRALATLPETPDAGEAAAAPDRAVEVPDLAVGVLGKAAMALLFLGDGAWHGVYDRLRQATSEPLAGRREIFAHYSVASVAIHAGHHRVAGQVLDRALAGLPDCENPTLAQTVRSARATLDYHVGAWDGLADRLDALLAAARPGSDVRSDLATVRGCMALAYGDFTDAGEWLRPALDRLEPGNGVAAAADGLIRLALARGDVPEAVDTAARLWEALEAKQLWAPLPRVLPSMVRAAVADGRQEDARRLLAVAEDALSGADVPLAATAGLAASGVLAAHAHRWGDAARDLLAAAEGYEERQCPYEAARAREEAAVAVYAGAAAGAVVDAGVGERSLREALAGYERLGATWDLDRARHLARRHGLRVPGRHRGGRRGYGEAPSPREREVVALAAVGRSNAEIAEELFLSVSTVKKHLATAMRKLKVHSRTALAHRWAVSGQQPGKDGPAGP